MADFILAFLDQFSNREIAAAIWGGLTFALLVIQPQMRAPFGQLVSAILRRRILLTFGFLLLYVACVLAVLRQVGLWDPWLNLKDVLVWIVFAAVPLVIKSTDNLHQQDYFVHVLKGLFKVTIMVEFITSAYTLSLVGELVLWPFAALVGATLFLAESRSEYHAAAKLIRWIAAAIGVFIIYVTIRGLIADPAQVFAWPQFLSLLLPTLLTILLIPFVYCLALSFAYESAFIRLRLHNTDTELIRYAKGRILLHFGIKHRGLTYWLRNTRSFKVYDRGDVRDLIGS